MRKAVIRTIDGLLLSHGFVDFKPTAEETVLDVPEDFARDPRQWRWDGAGFVPYTPPPKTDAEKVAEAGQQLDGAVLLKAVALWCAQRFGVPANTARAEIAAIYKTIA